MKLIYGDIFYSDLYFQFRIQMQIHGNFRMLRESGVKINSHLETPPKSPIRKHAMYTISSSLYETRI
jgi:hypothetical protein